MSGVLGNPAEMIAHGAPRLIHNDAELEAYTNALFQLTALESPSSSEVEAIELLTLLVERYEQEHYSIPAISPLDVYRLPVGYVCLAQQ
jgi:HTH-type transcriptional regulator/antitoxin HigA